MQTRQESLGAEAGRCQGVYPQGLPGLRLLQSQTVQDRWCSWLHLPGQALYQSLVTETEATPLSLEVQPAEFLKKPTARQKQHWLSPEGDTLGSHQQQLWSAWSPRPPQSCEPAEIRTEIDPSRESSSARAQQHLPGRKGAQL